MKTRELTAEDIAIHTPFKVRVLDTVTNTVKVVNFAQGSSTHWVGIKTVLNYSNIYKPILIPKKYLQNELVSIFIDAYGSKDDIHLSNISKKGNQIIEWFNDNGNGLITAQGTVQVYKKHELVLPPRMMREVYKRKIDVNNLIGQGLAISTEDIKDKVYE